MLDATASVAAVAGYSAMSVEDIITTARLSRRTFYDMFDDKNAVFQATFQMIVDELRALVKTVDRPKSPLEDRASRILTAIAEYLRDRPEFADVLLVQSVGASHEVVHARNELLETVTQTVSRAARADRKRGEPASPKLAAELVVGGIVEVFHSRVLRGEYDKLPQLVPALLHSTLQVYIGRRRADAAFG